ncbi:MAG: outer membrane beta-barrel protein [Kiritimatiellae bacterium]|nr:outer membrane beta-barrel protein [Kiritimatiellia bacterium]
MKTKISAITTLALAATAITASADFVDRPKGFRIGKRLTLRPYVSLSYTYDSNIDSAKKSKDASIFVVNPGLGAEYIDENWEVLGRAWYSYHGYSRYKSRLNKSSYGENLSFKWTDSLPNEKGWSVMLTESFTQIAQDDDMTAHNGRGIGRDRKTFQIAGIVERRINEKWHAAGEASFYYLDYDNNIKEYAPLYGWKRTTVGGEIGYAASRWTDLLLAANYQWYTQDNIPNSASYRYSDESRGWVVMAGLGTRATERISYRILTGWSRFEYANGDAKDVNGWTYQVSAKWKLSDTWNTMLLASSYYQPSEREVASAIRVDSISWGLAHSMVRGKLNATFDLNYRRETHEYSFSRGYDYDDDIITARLGLNYTLNRFLQLYGRIEYQTDMCDGGNVRGHNYDYDRFRGTVGMRLTY